jgi:hypothetical protein
MKFKVQPATEAPPTVESAFKMWIYGADKGLDGAPDNVDAGFEHTAQGTNLAFNLELHYGALVDLDSHARII